MSIRSKVIGCYLAVLLVFAGAAVYNYARLSRSNERLVLVNQLIIPLSRLTVELQAKTYTLADDLRRFYFPAGRTSEQSTFSRVARDLYPYIILRKFSLGEQLLAKYQKNGNGIEEISSLFQQTRSEFEQLSQTTEGKEFKRLYVNLRTRLKTLSERLDKEAANVTLAVQAEGRDNLIWNLILSTLVVVFGIFTLLFSIKVLQPLPALIGSIKKIADGDLSQSLKVKAAPKDEVSMLAREYNRMLNALLERDKKIQVQQKELLQAERLAAVGQLSAEVVHEIRNPLNSISLNIDWLESEMNNSGEEIKSTLRSVSREIERLNQITESYLVRARVPSSREDSVEAHEVLEEILNFSKEENKAKGIEVVTDLTPTEIYVKTSRSRLKQVFLNVLKNAREAMPLGGTLTVRSRVENNTSTIEFQDTGFGMNESTRRNTFSPFFTTKRDGTGLGLVLTKNIVEEAHGSIRCDSQLGKGTTFEFQFPV
ncbi:MAG: HAMP domain-containing protein [Bdellovibrionaceae bacterium]|nr:HAMP domain-containing protein [Pseudobdellovibrionaceae bacterium]